MLTDDDLKKIGEVVDKKIEARLEPIKGELKTVKKDMKTLKKNQEVMLDMLNRDDVHLAKRVTRIEKHLILPPLQ